MNDLVRKSIEIIRENQTSSGAYLACPNFPTYNYTWFRDGAFTAYAMDLAGEAESARRFHHWAAARVNASAASVRAGLELLRKGQPFDEANLLRTRYPADGRAGSDEWPNFQLDGFGTWLWALEQHLRIHSQRGMPPTWSQAADLVADYLTALWEQPCYDCWEEIPDLIHAYTLAAIYAGLRAHAHLSGRDHRATLQAIHAHLMKNAASSGHFVKFPGQESVDASLLGLAVPYQVVPVDDERMLATVRQVEATLRQGGGLHRYAADTYYGGGEWLLLTAWLGWYYCELQRVNPGLDASAKARACLEWIESQAGEETGWLPEQVPNHLNDPSYYPHWCARWGEIATPLLWSHAKYLILAHHLNAD